MELQDTKDQLFRVQKEFKVKTTKNHSNTKLLFALFMYYFALILYALVKASFVAMDIIF